MFFTKFTWLCRLICMNPFARSRVTSCWYWCVMVQIMQMVIVTAILEHVMQMSLLCAIDVHVRILPREEVATAQYIIYQNKCCTNLIYIITYMLHGHICAICAAVIFMNYIAFKWLSQFSHICGALLPVANQKPYTTIYWKNLVIYFKLL